MGVPNLHCQLVSGPDDLWYGELSSPDLSDADLPDDLCRGLAELLAVLGCPHSAVVVWMGNDPDDPRPPLPHDGTTQDPEGEEMHYRFCDEPALSAHCSTVWQARLGLRLFPSVSPAEGLAALHEQLQDLSDERRLGLIAPEADRGVLRAIGAALLHVARFAFRLLLSRSYREELLNPFRQAHWLKPTMALGAYIEKIDYDEDAVIAFMSRSEPKEELLRRAFGSSGRTVTVEKPRQRTAENPSGPSSPSR
jgi:hypothetical protein